MKINRTHVLRAAFCGAIALAGALPADAQITFKSGVSLPNGGEVVSFDPASGKLFTTDSLAGTRHAIQAYTLDSSGTLATAFSVDLNSVFGSAAAASSVSSVYADSRGFGVATIIPTATGTSDFGKIAFFDMATGSILHSLEVGYHPDSVTITPDHSKLLIANEGEYVASSPTRQGSVSVVDLSGVTGGNFATAIPALTGGSVSTHDFSAGNLGAGVTLAGTRNNRLDTLTVKTADAADIEPEYIAATNDKAYVTLQENNAIATLDLTGANAGKYTKIALLGTIAQTVDASDRDGAGNSASIGIDDVVQGMPMPDTIVTFTQGSTRLLATANEGDFRADDGDKNRAASLSVDTADNGGGDAFYSGAVNNAGIGRLNLSTIDGNTDGDAAIDVPTMPGTRSISVWNADTGALAFDTGSMIEQYVAANDATTFNMNDGAIDEFDKRSDDKGPEPEALAFGSIDGRDYLFLGNERQNGIFQFDITDLENVSIAGYFNTASSTLDAGGPFISPETIQFIASANSPTGENLLVVGYEGTGSNGSVAVYSVVPEPSTLAALLGGLGLMGIFRRRRLA